MAEEKKLGPAAQAAEQILAGIVERADNAPDEPYVDDSITADPTLLHPVPVDLAELALKPQGE